MVQDENKKNIYLRPLLIILVGLVFIGVLFITLYRNPLIPAATPTSHSATVSPSTDDGPTSSTPPPTSSNPPTYSGTPTSSLGPSFSGTPGPSSSLSGLPSPSTLPSFSLSPLPDAKLVAIIKLDDAIRGKIFDVSRQKEGDFVTIYDKRPMFVGLTYPNIEVALYLSSDEVLYGKVKADEKGNFSFRPSKDLELGKHYAIACISYLKDGKAEFETSRRAQFEVAEESEFVKAVSKFNPFWSSLAILGLALLALLNPFSEIGTYLYRLWISFLEWLGIRKKRKAWGTAYDYLTKKGLPLVVVRIIDRESGRVKETYVTDKEGSYYFSVPAGEYLLKAYKSNYVFPVAALQMPDDQEWQKGRSDGSYQNIYAGGFIKIAGEEELLNFDLPLEFSRTKNFLTFGRRVLDSITKLLNRIRIPLLLVGTFFSLFTLIIFTSWLDILIFIFYLLLWALEISRMIYLARSSGLILDKDNDQPLAQAMVKLIKVDVGGESTLETKVTNRRGSYNFLASPGNYRLQVLKGGFEQYQTEVFSIKEKRFLDFKIKLSRSQ